jgi:thioredoxin reductase
MWRLIFNLKEFIVNSDPLDQIDLDEKARIKTDYNMRTDFKRIFSAGDVCTSTYFATNDRLSCDDWFTAYHQGYTAGYNI